MSNNIKVTVLRNYTEIFKLAKETGHLYVINTSDRGGTAARGDVSLSIRDEDRQEVPVLIPATWLPIDLATFSAPEHFERANIFRQYLRNGLLAAVSEDTVKQIQSLPGANDEEYRVRKITEGLRNVTGTSNFVGTGDEITLNTSNSGPRPEPKMNTVSQEDLAAGNTPEVKLVLSKVETVPRSEFHTIKSTLVDFLTRATLDEVKALAAGISDSTNSAFGYIDAYLNAAAEGRPITTDAFDEVVAIPDANPNQVGFQVGA